MSHVATIEIIIKDLEALKQACKECGLEFVQGQKTYKWYGKWVQDYHGNDAAYKHGIDPKNYGKCDHAIRVPNNPQAYEIGVVKVDKGYTLVWDFWNGGFGLEKLAGPNCSNVVQNYSKNVTLKKLRNMGYSVKHKTNTEGDIEIEATR